MFILRSIICLTLILGLFTFITAAAEIDECQNATLHNCSQNATCTDTKESFQCECNSGYEGNGTICFDIDECKNSTLNKCSSNANCANTDGSFKCKCKTGFDGNGTTCNDIDECKNSTLNKCSPNANCTNTDGSFKCTCKTGFDGNGTTCTDLDECKNTTLNNCSPNADCKNKNGSFDCKCKSGFEGDGTTCSDECKNTTLHNCSPNADCKNKNGSLDCKCNSGYEGDGTTCSDIDECENTTLNNCSPNADCKNKNGSFDCKCNPGYEGDGTTCSDLDECNNSTLHNCSPNADCTNKNGSFDCKCKSGYEGNGTTCSDIDECKNSTPNKCSPNANCTNTPGSFKCKCKTGFGGNGTTCNDIDECKNTTLHNCSPNADCTNKNGSFDCKCNSGYEGDGTTCSDIDECKNTTLNNCSPNADCTNKNGSFDCKCNPGYEGDGTTCSDECKNTTLRNCSPNADCKNKNRSFDCKCNSGYEGDGTTCSDIDECENTTLHNCSPNADCTNKNGSFDCKCNSGYEGDGTTCSDIDECKNTTLNNCSPNADCKNKNGSFDCNCKSGFEGDGTTCSDIDECNNSTLHNCSPNADCKNKNGSFDCKCNSGFEGDGTTCSDECKNTTLRNCSPNADCTNKNGSFDCKCKSGYEGDGTTCSDIDECNNSTLHNCSPNADCTNKNGSFDCKCNSGYEGDGTTCSDIDECENTTLNNCSPNADCTNKNGSFDCKCKSGFEGDGTSCSDIDECKNTTLNNCSRNADCKNKNGSFDCKCKSGYEGDGTTCSDIDECKNSTLNKCSSNANCTNTPGSFKCKCKTGFGGNGTTCNDIDECKNSTLYSCPPNEMCKNTIGNYECVCDSGYENNGTTCIDIDECKNSTLNKCSSNANCANTDGSFKCTCKTGFDGNGTTCNDIDECQNSTLHKCQPNQTCKNTNGSYDCVCNSGYERNGSNCIDIDECKNTTLHNCSPNADCKNENGSFDCKCKSGFEGNGTTCSDIDECKNSTLNKCSPNANCTNTVASFKCKCKTGFDGNGTTCNDIDECQDPNLNVCSGNADCNNTIGDYNCNCKSGFEGSGKTCTDIDECLFPDKNDCSSLAVCNNTKGGYSCHCIKGYEGNGTFCKDQDECKDGSAQCDAHADCTNKIGSYTCACKKGFRGNGKQCKGIPLFEYTSAIKINKEDKMYGPYDMDSDIHAFERIFSTVYVSQNGYISLGSDPRFKAQPLANHSFPKQVVILAPFWTALDLSAKGKIFIDNYKICKPNDHQKLKEIGESISNFTAKRALVITWENVSPYPASEFEKETITFQAVLVSNENQIYVMFNYDTEKINFNEKAVARNIVIGYSKSGKFESLTGDNLFEWLKTPSTGLTGRRFLKSIGNNKENSMACLDWFCNNEGKTVGANAGTACPCTEKQAASDYTFKLKKGCYETVFAQNDIMQTCCYDKKWGALLLGYPDGGHMYNKSANLEEGDKLCCKDYKLCNLFYEVYPSHNCTGYTVPKEVLIWDPLVFQFSTGGNSVIFYGSGEYHLVNTNGFKLQARIEFENNTDTPAILSNKPKYTAFAIKVGQDKLEFTKNGKAIVASQSNITVEIINEQEKLVRTPTMQMKVVLNGENLGVTLFVPSSEKSTQLGLVSGSLQNGTTLDKSLAENIYETFNDWKVSNQNDSLFTYETGKGFSKINSAQVTLEQFKEINANLTKLLQDNINKSTEICGGKKRHCEMEFLLDNSTTILIAEKAQVVNQEILKNFPPVFESVSQAVVVYKSISMEVEAKDPESDTLKITLDTQLNANAYQFEQNTFNWTLNSTQLPIPSYVKFFASDVSNATTLYWPEVFLCNCKNRNECKESAMNNKRRLRFPDDDNKRDDIEARMYRLPCDCREGFTGNCETVVPRCSKTTCYPNVVCNASKSGNPCGPCPKGMEGDGIKCYDINQCSKNVCSQKCEDLLGNKYVCSCNDGYKLADDKKACIDINECLVENNCTTEQYCENNDGGYSCKCNLGYLQKEDKCISLKGKTKVEGSIEFLTLPNTDQAWSEDLKDSSSERFKTLADKLKVSLYNVLPKDKINTLEVISFKKVGAQQKRKKRATSPVSIQGNYEVIGTNVSATSLKDSLQSSCKGTTCQIGSLKGISSNSISVQAASLCPSSPCDPISTTCVDQSGYQCLCKPGFQKWAPYNDNRCKDIDECAQSPSPCGTTTCNNTVGSYICNCDDGFVFDSKDKKCVDVCSNNVCNHGICIPNANDFRCSCKVGWTGEKCDQKDVEKAQMKINLIIVASVLGSVCFLLFLIIIITCCRSKSDQSDPTEYYTSDTPWRGLPRAHLRDLELNENGSRLDLTKHSNQYDSLPGMLNPAFDPDDTGVNRC